MDVLHNKNSIFSTPGIDAFTFDYHSDAKIVDGILLRPKAEGKYPVIVWNRGGTGDFGKMSRDTVFLDLLPLAEAGYVVIASQYREDDEHLGADLHDIVALEPIIRSLDFADADKIGMIGHSRGGAAVYHLLRTVTWIKAAAIIAGPTDYTCLLSKERPDMLALFERMGIASKEDLHKRSALTFVEALPKDVPILLIHGTEDSRVPLHHSADMKKVLDELGIPNEFLILPGRGHLLREFRQEAIAKILEFFTPILHPVSSDGRS